MNLPNLESAKEIVIDVETKDLNLLTKGPGAARKDGHIVGLGVGVEGKQWYFPIRHEYPGSKNMNPEQVLSWARKELCRPNQPKIGANLMYDLEFLAAENVHVEGPFNDIQYAEPLLNEHAFSYSLDAQAKKYLNESKVDDALYEWLHTKYGGSKGRKQAGNIWRAPIDLVTPYVLGDVDLPLRIFKKQQVALENEGLMNLFDIESRLIPLLLAMRLRGVKVDVAKSRSLNNDFGARIRELQIKLNNIAGIEVNCNAAASIAIAADKLGIKYPRTKKTKAPSFVSKWLENHNHELMKTIYSLRKLEKVRGTFTESYILNNAVNGRIHCQFHPLRNDEYGTVSGRYSSSNPNLQNIPARDEILAPLIRGLFIPEEGEDWYKFDWSQIEYRCLAHYALGRGANEIREQFRRDPKTDYHVMTQNLIKDKTGRDIGRKPTKNINFGLVYGMGKPALCNNLGLSKEEGEELFEAYFEGVPFVQETTRKISSVSSRRGYIKTLLGRRARFPFWEEGKWRSADEKAEIEKEKGSDWFKLTTDRNLARKKWGRVQRARTHKAANSLFQGSAADLMKLAMVQVWESGVCDVTGAPLLTVHDELDFSIPRTNEGQEAAKEIKHIMETCYELKVPLIADMEIGTNWGNVK